jgi:glucosamine 6-phosphate synthetase-like amidotransferase/phosphosugar isomerase protein
MRVSKFMHGTLADADRRPVTVFVKLDDIVFWYRSPNSQATHLVASGGAVIPVLESSEQVADRISGTPENKQGVNE